MTDVKTEGGLPEPPALKIFIAVPCYDKKTFVVCTQSLMNSMQALLLLGIPFEFKFEVGDPYVSMARNKLARYFMKSDCTDMIFIDADLGYDPQSFCNLVTSPEEVIGGAYPKKSEKEEYAVYLKTDEGNHPINVNGVLEAEGLATGFLKIKRVVFEKMIEAYPELAFDEPLSGEEMHNFFGTFVKDRRWYGDDFGFCYLWRQLGGKLWLLPNITFTHVGSKPYIGNFHEYLLRQPGREFRPIPPALAKAFAIEGYMTEPELEWLFNKAGEMESVIELGSWKGRSTAALLAGCKGQVTSVDNWKGHDPSTTGFLEREASKEDILSIFMANVGDYPNLNVCLGDTDGSAEEATPADMVFIDAEHTYEACKRDIQNWLPKAKKLISGHDYCNEFPGVMRAVNEAFGEVKIHETIWYKELL